MPKKCKTGVFITAPNRAPAETQQSGFGGKRTSDRERESCRLRRDEGFVVRSDDGQHRICLVCGEAAALPNALGGAWPHTPKLRAEAHTHQAASVSAETLLPASGGAASKGDQSPFEEPPALRGDERNHFRKVTNYEKRYQIQHAHGVRRPREDQSAGGEGPHVHERLRHRLLSRQADRGYRRAERTAPPAQGHRRQHQPAHRPRQHGKVQVIGLEKAAGELSEVSVALRSVMEGR